jgi:hypothetical protein
MRFEENAGTRADAERPMPVETPDPALQDALVRGSSRAASRAAAGDELDTAGGSRWAGADGGGRASGWSCP